jgi:hypothetical protein
MGSGIDFGFPKKPLPDQRKNLQKETVSNLRALIAAKYSRICVSCLTWEFTMPDPGNIAM